MNLQSLLIVFALFLVSLSPGAFSQLESLGERIVMNSGILFTIERSNGHY
jgi:hypothetical protein